MKKLSYVFIGLALVVVVSVLFIRPAASKLPSHKLQVVAAENFWGSLASQIGGNRASVQSIVSDPNADPHEYESNASDARAIATANYVIINGDGYDSWASKILAASPSPKRQLLNVQTFLSQPMGANPHFWYSPNYVNEVVKQIAANYCSLDSLNCGYYQNNLKILQAKLGVYQGQIANITKDFKGEQVASTESIFVYLAKAAGLNLVSPPDFIEAVAEGNDPPAQSVASFEQQLDSGQVKLLVYNEQTVTPLTTSMKQLAAENNIPVVGITETIQPPNVSFEDWMEAEIINIENALNAQALGQ